MRNYEEARTLINMAKQKEKELEMIQTRLDNIIPTLSDSQRKKLMEDLDEEDQTEGR